MRILKQDITELFDTPHNLIFTSNAVRKSNGELVMGAGVALAFRNRWPDLAAELGNKLNFIPINTPVKQKNEYNLVQSTIHPNIWAFQTKYHWRNPSDADLVINSLKALAEKVSTSNELWYMTPPGCGLGGLDKQMVLKLVEQYIPYNNLIICDLE